MAKHGTLDDGMECACCYDDIMEENYVEYRTGEGMGKFWLDEQYRVSVKIVSNPPN